MTSFLFKATEDRSASRLQLTLVGLLAIALWQPLTSCFAKPGSEQVETLPRVFVLNAECLDKARQRLRQGDPTLRPALEALLRDARAALDRKSFSVMDKTATPPSGDKHDYMSQAPYFWPNPATSNGLPYVRHDGRRNPEIKRISDHDEFGRMSHAVETLALAYYFTGDETMAAKAAEQLRAWFLAPATRMNPNLQYAQAVRGVNTGRGIGLIESRGLVDVVDAAGLLAGSKSWTTADEIGLKQWFAAFLDWMQHSKHGMAEAAAKNNHGTYYDVQSTSFALFLGQTNVARQIVEAAKTRRIAVQIEPDGRQPLELARTKAWSYSVGNLSGLMLLARLGENVGVDLWHFQTPDGRSIRKALDFLVPYALRRRPWPYPQLGGWSPRSLWPLMRQAALRFDSPEYADPLPPEPAASRSRLLLCRSRR